MKTFKKLILLMVLGMGACVNTNADSVQEQIRKKVNAHQNEINTIKNSNQLNHLLAELKAEILNILNSAPELCSRAQALKEALERLNPSDKLSIAANIKAILANLDADIASTIRNAIPQVYRPLLGI